jgi:hypothetical protein
MRRRPLLLSGSIRHELRPAIGPDNAASYRRIRCRNGQTLLSNASNRRCDRETVPAGPFFSTDRPGNPLDRARPHPQSAAASAGRGCPQSQISIDHSCCPRSRSSGAFRRRPGRGNLRAFMRPPSETHHSCRPWPSSNRPRLWSQFRRNEGTCGDKGVPYRFC